MAKTPPLPRGPQVPGGAADVIAYRAGAYLYASVRNGSKRQADWQVRVDEPGGVARSNSVALSQVLPHSRSS